MVVGERLGRRVSDQVLRPQAEHPAQVLALLVGNLGSWRLAAHGAIANGEDLTRPCALDAEALVHQQPSAVGLASLLADALAEGPRKGAHANTGDPNHDPVVEALDALLRLQVDLFTLHLLYHRIELHVHALIGKVILHVGSHRLVEHCQKARQGFHQGHLEVLRDLRVPPYQVVLDEVGELATELHTRGAATHDDDVQELLHLGHVTRRPGHVRLLNDVEHFPTHLPAVFDLLQKHPVLVHARDAESVRLGTHGDD
mmetsp:Transcript_100300/g.214921  ORF Transcript_100300/g.214921 Transcript_100300/m.214921 type:complete len:257 (-) Transcript_100300:541-1311(-)